MIHLFIFNFVLDTFYSSSDSESEDERERKIHVEIKPINVNGSGPISASVDELRATIENLSLSPIGVLSVSIGSLLKKVLNSNETSNCFSLNHTILCVFICVCLCHNYHNVFLTFFHSIYVRQSPNCFCYEKKKKTR